MLKAFFKALARGLRKAGALAFGVFMLPFGLFGGGGRRSMPGLDIAAVKQARTEVVNSGMKPSELVQSQMRDSQIAWTWVVGNLVTNSTRPFPLVLSRTMQSWLQGLDHAQLVALKNAGPVGIFEHSSGKNKLAAVPPVSALAPVTIKYPTPNIRKPADEVAELRLTPA